MKTKTYDLVVFGGGGASALARRAGEAGLKTALIEDGPLGGTCPNRGCIPSKILLQHATVAETARRAGQFHIQAKIGAADTARILASTREEVAGTDAAIEGSFGKNVTLLRGRGELADAFTVRVGDRAARGKRLVISTGTRPAHPETPEGVRDLPYMVSDDLFALERAPASLLIVGGGYIACEFAHFFSALGTKVTMVQRSPELLTDEDEETRHAFNLAFASRVDLRTKSRVARVARKNGTFATTLEGDGAGTVRSEALVYAIGRRPNTDAIGIERTGIALDERGYVLVDDFLESSVKGVYATGDVNGRHLFTHAATVQNEYLGGQLTRQDRRGPIDHGPMPHAVFTDPEVAGVGLTEQELRERGAKFVKSVVRYEDVPKGVALKEAHGLAKLLATPRGEILGFHVVGPEASILLHQVVVAMRWRNHVSSLTGAITVHPSLNELVAETAWQVLDELPASARRGPR